MLSLIRTLYDITLLRKGPEDIPRSGIILALCFLLSIAALLSTTALVPDYDQQDAAIDFARWLLGVGCYAIVIAINRQTERMLQTQAALIGTGALISFGIVAVIVLLTPFFSRELAFMIAMLVLFWSVPVKGHIIARAINQHWYIGIVFAMTIFVLQFLFTTLLSTALSAGAE